jgi:agmatine deiminase
MTTASSPASLGFRMPAEWEAHDYTWIAWPHHRDDWPGKFEPIAWVYADIVFHLAQSERVRILVNTAVAERKAQQCLSRRGVDIGRVEFHCIRTDRVWARDFGPLCIRDATGVVGATHWGFNGWAKYDNWQRDFQAGSRMASVVVAGQQRDDVVWSPEVNGRRVVLEGGSIDVNGAGLLLTTEECLLSPVQARNPDLSRTEVEQVLCDYLGVRQVLWLGRGIAGDDTHGHVDDLARFVGPRTVVTVVENDTADPNYEALRENVDRLSGMKDLAGRSLEVVKLPMPAPLFFDGQRLPASYANFYIANDRVLVPTFNDPNDRVALGILADLFPDRKVVGIHAGDLIWGLGTLHCLTQQQPARSAS